MPDKSLFSKKPEKLLDYPDDTAYKATSFKPHYIEFFMAKRCDLTGTGPLAGNNVSHSNHRTRTRFMPNLQNVSLMSDALGRTIRLKITAATLRTVEHNGGLDKFLLKRADKKLTAEAQKLKRAIKKKNAAAAKAEAA